MVRRAARRPGDVQMSHEFSVVTPHGEKLRVVVDQQVQCPPVPGVAAPIDPEHVRAVEAVFTQTQKDKESDQVLGLLGLWTGTLLMHDLARETFDKSAEEKEEEAGEDDDPHLPNPD
jgi:hypothetical protein